MKKLKAFSLFFSALMVASCFAAFGAACGEDNGKDGARLKVGLMSDPHCITTTSWNGSFVKTLTYFKEQEVDAIVIAGDITDIANTANYAVYNKAVSDVYGNDAPEMILTMGNHDFWTVKHSVQAPKQQVYDLFEDEVGQTVNYHTEVNGFHFIALSPDTHSLNFHSSIDWLEEQLAEAAADAPDNPIFIVAHTNAAGTTPGATSAELGEALENYPQAVVFSGHTHYAVQDERTIYQENFTSIDLGASSYYTIVDRNYENKPSTQGQMNMFARLLTVNGNEMEIKRVHVGTGETEKQPYTFKLPLKKEEFTYTSARAENAVAPTFAEGASITVTATTVAGAIKLSFPAASCPTDMVYAYRVRIAEQGATLPIVNKFYATDFYKGVASIKQTNEYTITGLEVGKTYEISITARESFGKFTETPLTATYTVPAL